MKPARTPKPKVGRYCYRVAKTEISTSTTIITVGIGIGRRAASDQECHSARGFSAPLGDDHDAALPLVFRTLVFTDDKLENENYDRQCSTWAEAEVQHAEVVKNWKAALL